MNPPIDDTVTICPGTPAAIMRGTNVTMPLMTPYMRPCAFCVKPTMLRRPTATISPLDHSKGVPGVKSASRKRFSRERSVSYSGDMGATALFSEPEWT